MKSHDIHNVEPAEDLMKIALETDTMVDSKWQNVRVKPVMVSEDDRKTGQISAAASQSLQNAGTTPTI